MRNVTVTDVRPAVSAGRYGFYPSDPQELRLCLRQMFQAVKVDQTLEPIGLVAPHAGYVYSGPTAAHAYKLLQGRRYDRVIIVAPSHYAVFPGASLFPGRAYETPLGLVPVDREFADALWNLSNVFDFYPDAETREHSLEVQLPFLQFMLPDFKIVPIVVYDRSLSNCQRVARAIVEVTRKTSGRTLLVASSDLYHGPGAVIARTKSLQAARAIEKMDPTTFSQGIEAGEFQACGAGPITIVMLASKELGATRAKVLALTTSYDVHPGREDYVVGYLAAVFFK
ncbi:MAG: AmmeMemoRadiSam system protein B [Candidatus Hydrogenedentota bacterium]|nr:MAG: AmmeMemoRadiSam system protein B [Candidatus Hydrogenedentota bacterium]